MNCSVGPRTKTFLKVCVVWQGVVCGACVEGTLTWASKVATDIKSSRRLPGSTNKHVKFQMTSIRLGAEKGVHQCVGLQLGEQGWGNSLKQLYFTQDDLKDQQSSSKEGQKGVK